MFLIRQHNIVLLKLGSIPYFIRFISISFFLWFNESFFLFKFQETHGIQNYATMSPIKANVTAIQTVNNALARFYSKSKSTKHHREYISDSDSDSDSDDERPKGKRTVSDPSDRNLCAIYFKSILIKS